MILERQYRTCMVITEERTSFRLSLSLVVHEGSPV
jgi:hypothetical protein